jgi:hypothetical protein
MHDHNKAETFNTLCNIVEHEPYKGWGLPAGMCALDVMEDLYAAPASCCTFRDVAGAITSRGAKKCSTSWLVILLADDHLRCPQPRERLRIKRQEDKPFQPASQDQPAWAYLASVCKQLDGLLQSGTATEQELGLAWEKVCKARVPNVEQLGAFMRTELAVKHVLITKVLQLLQEHVSSKSAKTGRPLAVLCDYQHHTRATLHGPVDAQLTRLSEYLYAHPHQLGESDHKVSSGGCPEPPCLDVDSGGAELVLLLHICCVV